MNDNFADIDINIDIEKIININIDTEIFDILTSLIGISTFIKIVYRELDKARYID